MRSSGLVGRKKPPNYSVVFLLATRFIRTNGEIRLANNPPRAGCPALLTRKVCWFIFKSTKRCNMRSFLATLLLLSMWGCGGPYMDLRQPIYLVPKASFWSGCKTDLVGNKDCRA